MPNKAAAGAGTIRKKTVTRNGKQYSFWEARITTGKDGRGRQIQRSFFRQNTKGSPGKDAGCCCGDNRRRIHRPGQNDRGGMARRMEWGIPEQR